MGSRLHDAPNLLSQLHEGDEQAAQVLIEVVYEELRRIAHNRMGKDGAWWTLQPTALVHEAYLKLCKGGTKHWRDKEHFCAAATLAMRHILIDQVRRKRRHRHGGGSKRISNIQQTQIAIEDQTLDLLVLEEALTRLERNDPIQSAVVTLRCVFGCTIVETASTLGISPSKVKKDWAFAKAWLQRELK